jgi:hypothetical protein
MQGAAAEADDELESDDEEEGSRIFSGSKESFPLSS